MKPIVWSPEANSLNITVSLRSGRTCENCVKGEILTDTLSVSNALGVALSYRTFVSEVQFHSNVILTERVPVIRLRFAAGTITQGFSVISTEFSNNAVS